MAGTKTSKWSFSKSGPLAVVPDVVCLTYRPDKGATGGPGGVLHLTKMLLGPRVDDLKVVYHFKDSAQPFGIPGPIKKAINRLGFWPDMMEAARFGFQMGWQYRHSSFITHDAGTACGLALARRRYALVYHQQGALASEKLGQGKKLNAREIQALNLVEAYAFKQAHTVHFPSNGAYRSFLDSSETLRNGDFNYGGPLYNTVPPVIETEISESPPWMAQLPSGQPLFLSVGAFTWEKGVDQVASFMHTLGAKLNSPVTWVLVGNGPFWDKIEQRCRSLPENITPIMVPGPVPHALIGKLMQRADLFFMGHRRSIFDFTTLEAMQAGCGLVLSPVGGNLEFDLRKNVIWLYPEDPERSAQKILQTDWHLLGQRNQRLFFDRFSPKVFKETYSDLCHTLHQEAD